MKIDLHAHSYYSDGVLSPADLVKRAVAQQVDVLALTDHDTVLGVEEALQAAESHAIKIIPGIEISCAWRQQTIHMIGLNVDVKQARLMESLAMVDEARSLRMQSMLKKLAKFGIPGIDEHVMRTVKGVSGRMHIARYLAEKAYAQTPGKAFKQFLAQGKPGFVRVDWMSLEEATQLILAAGGIPVIAHPRRYDFTVKKMISLFEHFKAIGGVGIEVATSSQNKSDQTLLGNLAKQLQLAISIGSDFHEPCSYNEVGKASFLIPLQGQKLLADLL